MRPSRAPDAAVGELCLSAETASVKDLASRISEDIASYSPEVWLRKLGDKTSVVSPEAASRLGVAVASCGHAFAGKHAKGDALRSLSETAASVIRELLRAVPQVDKRYESAASILDRAQPLSLAGYCLIRMARGSGEGDALFTEFEVQGLGRSLSHRICQESMGKPLYVTYPDDAKLLLSAWAKWGVPGECSGNVRSWLMKESTDALRLLKSFAGTMLANGIRMTSNLEDSTYSTLAEVVEPQAIADALARIPDLLALPAGTPSEAAATIVLDHAARGRRTESGDGSD